MNVLENNCSCTLKLHYYQGRMKLSPFLLQKTEYFFVLAKFNKNNPKLLFNYSKALFCEK